MYFASKPVRQCAQPVIQNLKKSKSRQAAEAAALYTGSGGKHTQHSVKNHIYIYMARPTSLFRTAPLSWCLDMPALALFTHMDHA